MIKNPFTKKNSSYSDDVISILRLIRSENIGIRTFYNVLKYYGSAQIALENIPHFMARIGKIKYQIFSLSEAEKEIELMEKDGAKFLTFNNVSYSKLLNQIEDVPPIISYKGDIKLLNTTCIAMVGARNCSISGKDITAKIAKNLTTAGVTIVSGLARGIDATAHEFSIPNTIAVIAGGIDHIYPPENHKLYKKIIDTGLLIAELPIGSVPLARHFPQRNRIISGLSVATIIVEAGLNSGSLITAKFALEQNREIFVIPGFPLDPRYKGSNKLIKDGANLLESADDVIEFLNKESFNIIKEDKNLSSSTLPIYKKVDYELLTDKNRKIVKTNLSAHPVNIEEIAIHSDLPMQIVLTILLELELEGMITYHPGNKVTLKF